jgi:hypothetical protein
VEAERCSRGSIIVSIRKHRDEMTGVDGLAGSDTRNAPVIWTVTAAAQIVGFNLVPWLTA